MVRYTDKCQFLKTNFSPLVFAAIILCLLVYSKAIKLKDNTRLQTLCNDENIVSICGTIINNPSLSKNEKYYSAYMSLSSVTSNSGSFYGASGNIPVLIPKDAVERFYPDSLFSKNLNSGVILCEQGSNIELTGRINKNRVFIASKAQMRDTNSKGLGKFYYYRGLLRNNFRRLLYTWGKAGGLLLALLSGIREYTDKTLSDNFRAAGLSHILALSGMHLNLFSDFAKKSFFFIKNTRLSSFISFLFVLLFVFFAGFSPSLFRAFLGIIIGFCVKLLKVKNVRMLKILSACFLIHLILRPSDAFFLAFILSYSALAGIVVVSELISFLYIIKVPEKIISLLSSSIGAQFFTSPITLNLLGSFSPVGIISTFFISPLVTFFIYAGIILILLSICFPCLSPAAAFFMKMIYNLIDCSAALFAEVPYISSGR